MKVNTQILASLIAAIATNLTVVGFHYAQTLTEWILVIASGASMLWFFIVVFGTLFRKMRAS